MKSLTLIVFSLALLSNTKTCVSKTIKKNNNPESTIQETEKKKYYINSLNGKDVSEEKLYIIFNNKDTSISGYAGCNTFSSQYTINDDSISIGFPIATKMYCEKKVALEQEFFKALLEIKTKTVTDDVLLLKDKNGNKLLSGTLKLDQ